MSLQNIMVIIDAECNVCNASASFIRRRQPKNKPLKIIASQSSEGKDLLKQYNILSAPQSIIVIENDIVVTQFSAVVRLTNHINISHMMRIIIKSIPLSLGNFLYNMVAKYRYILGSNQCENLSNNQQ